MKSGSKKFLKLFVEFPSPLAFVLNVIRLLTLSFRKEKFSKVRTCSNPDTRFSGKKQIVRQGKLFCFAFFYPMNASLTTSLCSEYREYMYLAIDMYMSISVGS